MKVAVQQKAQVARAFMMKPMMPVWLTVIISTKATTMAMEAAAMGPKTKPPMQMTTSLKSKSRKPLTLGSSLDTSMTTKAMAESMARVVMVLVLVAGRALTRVGSDMKIRAPSGHGQLLTVPHVK